MKQNAYTEGRVKDALFKYPQLIKDLYADFEKNQLPRNRNRYKYFDGLILIIT